MRLLVIGGTRFVGRHLVAAALERGHEVTLLHRGGPGQDPFERARHLHADRDGDLAVLSAGSWDATIDVCGYLPRQVRSLGDALGGANGRAGRYVFISSVSAYAELPGPGATEAAPLAVLADEDTQEITPETYGGLKALCEYAAVETFGTGTLIVRPTYVIGPYDPTGRFTYWVHRLARGGKVLAAGPPEQPIQTVDARDLAALTLTMVEAGVHGPVHVAAPSCSAGGTPFTLADLLAEVCRAVAPPGTRVCFLDPQDARRAGLDGAQLPLWHEGATEWIGALDAGAALRHGLASRPAGRTAADVLAHPHTPVLDRVGLSADDERRFLAES